MKCRENGRDGEDDALEAAATAIQAAWRGYQSRMLFVWGMRERFKLMARALDGGYSTVGVAFECAENAQGTLSSCKSAKEQNQSQQGQIDTVVLPVYDLHSAEKLINFSNREVGVQVSWGSFAKERQRNLLKRPRWKIVHSSVEGGSDKESIGEPNDCLEKDLESASDDSNSSKTESVSGQYESLDKSRSESTSENALDIQLAQGLAQIENEKDGTEVESDVSIVIATPDNELGTNHILGVESDTNHQELLPASVKSQNSQTSPQSTLWLMGVMKRLDVLDKEKENKLRELAKAEQALSFRREQLGL